MYLLRNLENHQFYLINCDEHPKKYATVFCKKLNKMVCSKCLQQNSTIEEQIKYNIQYKSNILSFISHFSESFEDFYQSNDEEQKQVEKNENIQQISLNIKLKENFYDKRQQQEAIIQVKPNQEHNMYKEFRRLVDKQFKNSKIIPSNLIPVIGKASLIYKATSDGFNSKDFHQKCDNQGNTISFILSEYDQVFGCYTTKPWKSPITIQKEIDKEAFIFSLTKNTIHKYFEFAVQHNKNKLMVFGTRNGISISSNCNYNSESCCSQGNIFNPEKGCFEDDQQSKEYLAGAKNFKVIEIEVYQVIK
ncbi:UNKNOWN [Stylonychia lemnae]|uniref:TLDc domain-containing protein n=1 Tax=Stylonychia lemnae TaxID=5949 RepID=A0A078AE25_STYLE|nr:UNKNOWN [Stylonychia lemnae]|eukprot:CDW80450.1 UNKNOWN [Stylonychia lemnae]